MNDLYDKIYRIKMVVLDPNGFCNSHCWYCPVKYQKNPEEFIHQMPISQVEHIFKNIKNSVFTSDTKTFNTTNFNEIFLYKKSKCQIYRK